MKISRTKVVASTFKDETIENIKKALESSGCDVCDRYDIMYALKQKGYRQTDIATITDKILNGCQSVTSAQSITALKDTYTDDDVYMLMEYSPDSGENGPSGDYFYCYGKFFADSLEDANAELKSCMTAYPKVANDDMYVTEYNDYFDDGYEVYVNLDTLFSQMQKNLEGYNDWMGDEPDWMDNEPMPFASTNIMSAEEFEDYEDEIKEIDQEFTSENTSINSKKLPALFNMVQFEPGTLNLNYGGGRWNNVAEYLTQYDVIDLVYDPYNRSKEHNQDVIKAIRNHGGADTATCSNVLNVIKEPEVRLNVLQNIKKLVKPDGKVYITVYEGTGKGDEGPTKSGYQLNRKTADYLDEVKQVFPDATRKGKLIVASPSGAVTSSINITAASQDTLDVIESELESALIQAMQEPRMGFPEDEARMYSKVFVTNDENGYVKAEVRAEVSYEGMEFLSEQLDPIVAAYDPDAYFDMECPGIMTAYMNIQDVTASTSITGMEYPDLDPDYNPNARPDPYEHAEDDVFELGLLINTNITVTEDGFWEYEDESWAQPSGSDEWYDDNHNLYMTTKDDVIETVDNMINDYIPEEPGTYALEADIDLVYDITDLYYSSEDAAYAEDYKVEFNSNASKVNSISVEPV